MLAFEPQRIVFQTLCANMALNSITNTRCQQAALGEERGSLLVPALDYSRQDNYGGLGLGDFQEGEEVEVLRLDDFALPHCRLIKVDVEGMELSVLRGGQGLIARHRPLLYVENDRQEKSAALIRFIASLGYDLLALSLSVQPGQLLRQRRQRLPEHRVLQYVLRPDRVRPEPGGAAPRGGARDH